MADSEGTSSTPWVAFLAGIVLVALIGFGYFAYSGGLQPEHQAQLEINAPQIKLPDPPALEPPAPSPAPEAPAPAQ